VNRVPFRAFKPLAMATLGLALAAFAGLVVRDGPAASAATKYNVFVGGGAGGIAIEEFMPSTIFVNVGDTIEWTNPYEEIHTVTFLGPEKEEPELIAPAGPAPLPGVAPPPGPPKLAFTPKAANPTAAKTYDGTAYANSGILGKGQSFSLTFPKQGSYPFDCLLHPGMEGTVYVLPAGTHVPTQEQRDYEAQVQRQAGIARGEASAAATRPPAPTTSASGASTYTVVVPASAGQSDVMRFVNARQTVNVGDTVMWQNTTEVPHTVTFTSGAPAPDSVVPEPAGAGPPLLVLAPQALFPSKPSQNYDGTGYYNSGFITADQQLATGGTSFSLTFTKPGTYSYICLLHADQGMAGVITVVAAGAPGGSQTSTGGTIVRPPSTGDAGLAARHGAISPLLALALACSLGLAGAFAVRARLHD
jgi:plastocyanin